LTVAEEIERQFGFEVRVKQATLKRFVHPVMSRVKNFRAVLVQVDPQKFGRGLQD